MIVVGWPMPEDITELTDEDIMWLAEEESAELGLEESERYYGPKDQIE